MADRMVPLIANSSANQIQELAASDNLNLANNSIVGVVSVLQQLTMKMVQKELELMLVL